jgi:hypothetical protein
MDCDDTGVGWVDREPWDDEAGVVGGPECDDKDGDLGSVCARFADGDCSSSNVLRFWGVID